MNKNSNLIILTLIIASSLLIAKNAQALTCTDTDGGDKPALKGSVTIDNNPPIVDNCFNELVLRENFCDANKNAVLKLYRCYKGCKSGACVVDQYTCQTPDFFKSLNNGVPYDTIDGDKLAYKTYGNGVVAGSNTYDINDYNPPLPLKRWADNYTYPNKPADLKACQWSCYPEYAFEKDASKPAPACKNICLPCLDEKKSDPWLKPDLADADTNKAARIASNGCAKGYYTKLFREDDHNWEADDNINYSTLDNCQWDCKAQPGYIREGNKCVKEFGCSWEVVGKRKFSRENAKAPSLAFNVITKEPYVAYSSSYFMNLQTVEKFDGSVWSEAINMPLFNKHFAQIVFNKQNMPYVAGSFVSPQQASVVHLDNQNWVEIDKAGLANNQSNQVILAFHPVTQQPYIALAENGHYDEITVRKLENGLWTDVGKTIQQANLQYYSSLAFNTLGTPYLAYVEISSNRIMVQKFDGLSWTPINSAFFAGYDPTLLIDSNNNTYLAYFDNAVAKIVVKKLFGSDWREIGSFTSVNGAAWGDHSLAVDKNGKLYLAFITPYPYLKVSVKAYDGSDWKTVGESETTNGTASWLNLAINPDTNEPYFAFLEKDTYPIDVKITVMRCVK